jgi:hypothetical protein
LEAWLLAHSSRKTSFTVKSAYFLEKSYRTRATGECSRAKANWDFWKSIWSSQVQPTVKHFVWKVCNNLLPTKENLFIKNIVPDPFCPLCQMEEESAGHILWRCPSAMGVWQECSRWVQKLSIMEKDGYKLVQHLMEKLEESEVLEVLTVMRMIWLRRKSFVFDRVFTSPSRVVALAMEALENFTQAINLPGSVAQVRDFSLSSWTKPQPDWLKLNWDAALDKISKRMGIGVVDHDASGGVIAAVTKWIPCLPDLALAEAMGAWEVVNLCCDRWWMQVLLEGDSLTVVSALNKVALCWSAFGQFLEDTRVRLSSLPRYEVRHINRTANQAAHLMAKATLVEVPVHLFWEACPPNIQCTVSVEQGLCP